MTNSRAPLSINGLHVASNMSDTVFSMKATMRVSQICKIVHFDNCSATTKIEKVPCEGNYYRPHVHTKTLLHTKFKDHDESTTCSPNSFSSKITGHVVGYIGLGSHKKKKKYIQFLSLKCDQGSKG